MAKRRFGAALGVLGALTAVALTGCSPSEPASQGGPVAVRRLTEVQYKQIIADVFGPTIKSGGRFEPDVRQDGLLAVGTGKVSVTAAGMEQYDLMARAVSSQVVDEKHRNTLINCKPANAAGPDEACAKQFLSTAGRLLYRRPLTQDELKIQVDVANSAAQQLGDFYAGLQMSLAGMLVAPPFLFRQEVAVADPAQSGSMKLDAYSKASRLSFLLWNTAPDDVLLTAAEKGELDSKEGLTKHVDRMLASPRLEHGVRAFFSDMLGYDKFDTLAKDTQVFPKFSFDVASDAREQTLRTVVDHLVVNKGDYRDLYTTRKTFLTQALGSIYRVPVSAPAGWSAFEYPEGDPRAGLLAHISFSALHSHPGRSSPTLRGKAVRELLLCQHVPDPPANVDFRFVQDTENPNFKTAKLRLEQHNADPTCAGCHKITDPIGLAMETFDSSGAFRTAENGAQIDASGELDGVPYKDAAGLGKAMRDNPATASCLVTRVYSYAAGHAPTKGQGEWMEYLQKSFASDGYRVPDLLRRIALSDTFYRVTPPEAAAKAPTVASAENH